jgi:hypothetical protein
MRRVAVENILQSLSAIGAIQTLGGAAEHCRRLIKIKKTG